MAIKDPVLLTLLRVTPPPPPLSSMVIVIRFDSHQKSRNLISYYPIGFSPNQEPQASAFVLKYKTVLHLRYSSGIGHQSRSLLLNKISFVSLRYTVERLHHV